MFIKIYFGDKPLFLCDEFTEEINSFVHHDDAVFIDEFSTAAVNSMLHEMKNEKVQAGIYYHADFHALKKAIWKKFLLVKAGGGLVSNELGQLLFIFRRGVWDLPKGKQDAGETMEECACREVREETGLSEVHLQGHIIDTFHTYNESGKHCLKETNWFLMQAASTDRLVPQSAEQIEIIKWVDTDKLSTLLQKTYPAIIDVLQTGRLVHA